MITVRVDRAKLRQVKAWLKKTQNQSAVVMSRAANKTATWTRTRVVRGVSSEVAAKQKDVREKIVINRASYADTTATVKVTGKRMPLIDFNATQTKAGVRYRLSKKGGRQLIRGAFIATMKSGHRGVYAREYAQRVGVSQVGEEGTQRFQREQRLGLAARPTSMQPQTFRRHRVALLRAEARMRGQALGKVTNSQLVSDAASEAISRVSGPVRVGRLPIREQFGPSIPGVVQKAPGLLDETLKGAEERMRMEIERQWKVFGDQMTKGLN